MFYDWVAEVDGARGRPLPLVLTLFGGYRKDDYNSVLALHAADLSTCLETLCGFRSGYLPHVRPKAAVG